jgi:peptidoglycan/LPS O-acetylase OafA/YrhL
MQSRDRWTPALDGVRGLSLIAIVAFHLVFMAGWIPAGGLLHALAWRLPQGLTAFFVLSGFLLYRPYVRAALDDRAVPRPRELWRRRFLRIYPTHTAVLLIACVALPLGLTIGSTHVGRLPADAVIANLLLVQGWFPHLVLSGLGPSWTLVVDVTFYALLPLMGWLALASGRRIGAPAGLLVPVLPLLAAGTFIRPWAWEQAHAPGGGALGKWSGVLYYTFPGQMDLVAAGMLGAVLAGTASWLTARMLVVVAVAAFAVLTFDVQGSTPVALGMAAALALASRPTPGPISRALAWRPLIFLGHISYAAYLWHMPILLATQRWGPVAERPLAHVATVTLATIALAWATTRWVGDPAIAWSNRLSARRPPEVDYSDGAQPGGPRM